LRAYLLECARDLLPQLGKIGSENRFLGMNHYVDSTGLPTLQADGLAHTPAYAVTLHGRAQSPWDGKSHARWMIVASRFVFVSR
jgi:hypothetical protein